MASLAAGCGFVLLAVNQCHICGLCSCEGLLMAWVIMAFSTLPGTGLLLGCPAYAGWWM